MCPLIATHPHVLINRNALELRPGCYTEDPEQDYPSNWISKLSNLELPGLESVRHRKYNGRSFIAANSLLK